MRRGGYGGCRHSRRGTNSAKGRGRREGMRHGMPPTTHTHQEDTTPPHLALLTLPLTHAPASPACSPRFRAAGHSGHHVCGQMRRRGQALPLEPKDIGHACTRQQRLPPWKASSKAHHHHMAQAGHRQQRHLCIESLIDDSIDSLKSLYYRRARYERQGRRRNAKYSPSWPSARREISLPIRKDTYNGFSCLGWRL